MLVATARGAAGGDLCDPLGRHHADTWPVGSAPPRVAVAGSARLAPLAPAPACGGRYFTNKGNDTSKGSTWARQAISSRTACSSWARIRQAHTCTRMTETLLLHHRCRPKCSLSA